MRFGALVCALSCALSAALAGPAAAREPDRRTPPVYPASCAPAPGEEIGTQTVIVAYEVNRSGVTENVRVRESSDPCFNEAAVAAVRGWTYKRGGTDELETTITFRFEEPAGLEDFDAAPLQRTPPQYPVRCMDGASGSETVSVEFDVTKEGRTENVRVVGSTHNCLNRTAVKAVEQWTYNPKLIGGEPVARRGVQVELTFQLSNADNPNLRVRTPFRNDILRVQSRLERGDDPQEALRDLQAIEEKYGDKFTMAETVTFHLVRGNARLRAGDYRGALDDFRLARDTGITLHPDIQDLIWQLEQAVAQEDAAAAEEGDRPVDAEPDESRPAAGPGQDPLSEPASHH